MPLTAGGVTYWDDVLVSDNMQSDDGDIFPAEKLLEDGYSIQMNDREMKIIPPPPRRDPYLLSPLYPF